MGIFGAFLYYGQLMGDIINDTQGRGLIYNHNPIRTRKKNRTN